MTGSMKRWLGAAAAVAMLFTISACSVHVDKDDNGHEKRVDITTPMGDLKVRNDGVVAKDTGLPVYPGAQEKPKEEHNDGKANVAIDTPFFGLKVVALTYTSADSQDKVLSWYRGQMKSMPNVVECKGGGHVRSKNNSKDDLNRPVSCDNEVGTYDDQGITNDSKSVQLKSGTNGNQHIVAVKPSEKGSEFSLVFVRVHVAGKEDSI